MKCSGNAATAFILPVLLITALVVSLSCACRGRDLDGGGGEILVAGIEGEQNIHETIVGRAMQAVSDQAVSTAQQSSRMGVRSQLARYFVHMERVIERAGMKVRILIALYQMLTQLGFVYTIPQPPIYANLLRWLDSVNLDIINMMPLSCQAPFTFYHTLLVTTLGSSGIIAFLFAISHWLKCAAVGNGPRKQLRNTVSNRCTTTAFFLIFLLYPSISSRIFTTFVCDELDVPLHGVHRFLRADLRINCDGDDRAAMLTFASVMLLIWPVGVPLLYMYLLYSNRQELEELARQETYASASDVLVRVSRASSIDSYRNSSVSREEVGLSRINSIDSLPPPPIERASSRVTDVRNEAKEKLPSTISRVIGGYKLNVYWFEVVEVRTCVLSPSPTQPRPASLTFVHHVFFSVCARFCSLESLFSSWKPPRNSWSWGYWFASSALLHFHGSNLTVTSQMICCR